MNKKHTFIQLKRNMILGYKNITDITYNYPNLPEMMTVTGKGTITYTYDAAGNKLEKVTQKNNLGSGKGLLPAAGYETEQCRTSGRADAGRAATGPGSAGHAGGGHA